MTAGPDFVSFFHCRPEKWGPERYGIHGPRLGWVHWWRPGGRRRSVIAGYSKRRPMRMRRRYLDTRRERPGRRQEAALRAFGLRLAAEIAADAVVR